MSPQCRLHDMVILASNFYTGIEFELNEKGQPPISKPEKKKVEDVMKKSRIALVTASFAAALVLYMLGATQYTYHVNNMNIQVYPAAFMGLFGLWMLIRPALKNS